MAMMISKEHIVFGMTVRRSKRNSSMTFEKTFGGGGTRREGLRI
jgi:hypothetical protein